MHNIEIWLKKFKNNWERKDVETVLNLFHEKVIYFETPFQQVENLGELRQEWKNIEKQKNINLTYKIFSKDKNKYSVLWQLNYADENNNKKDFAGTYLIELNNDGLCTYFHHACERKN